MGYTQGEHIIVIIIMEIIAQCKGIVVRGDTGEGNIYEKGENIS